MADEEDMAACGMGASGRKVFDMRALAARKNGKLSSLLTMSAFLTQSPLP
jgi:hypothetical protein